MPPDDLLHSLVGLYFDEENTYLPLLHRPTFEADLKDNKHWYDSQFAATVLLVCALGAASSDDPRVYVDGKGFPGWRWFIQVAGYCRLLADPTLPSIYEVQIQAVRPCVFPSIPSVLRFTAGVDVSVVLRHVAGCLPANTAGSQARTGRRRAHKTSRASKLAYRTMEESILVSADLPCSQASSNTLVQGSPLPGRPCCGMRRNTTFADLRRVRRLSF